MAKLSIPLSCKKDLPILSITQTYGKNIKNFN